MNRYMDYVGSVGSPESLVVVIDESPSMEDTDWKPTRLAGAVKATSALLEVKAEKHPLDRVGIVAFHSKAKIVHDLTPVKEYLDSLQHAVKRLSTSGGTNITTGLEASSVMLFGQKIRGPRSQVMTAIARLLYEDRELRDQQPAGARIVLLTDGHHNTGGSPCQIAQNLKARGVAIDIIGIGGNPSAVDEELLKRVSSTCEDGSPRYCFIADQAELVRTFKKLAHHIKPLGGG